MPWFRKQGLALLTHSLPSCAVLALSLIGLGYADQAQSGTLAAAQALGVKSQSRLENREPGSAANVPAVPDDASSANPACDDDARAVLTPTLSSAYLIDWPTNIGKPQLVVGYYNLSDGLLAGYQSASGKRILLRARWRANGAVSAEAAHFNPATGRIERLMGLSKQRDKASGLRAKSYEVAGVDLLSYLKEGVLKRRAPSGEADQVTQFLDGDAGRAFSEAIPALYATLESLEDIPKLAALQTPFGAILTALQASTGINGGFDQADSVLGASRAKGLREACGGQQCRYRGVHFTIQNSGLFDVLSKSKGGIGRKSLQCSPYSGPRSTLQAIVGAAKNGDGNCTDPGGCFGYCGPGCFTPGEVWTIQCNGHDNCVCKWDHASCLVTLPDDCEDCSTLGEAIESFLGELFRRLFESEEADVEDYDWW